MAAKINWHRYGTKLRHCHPMYSRVFCVRLICIWLSKRQLTCLFTYFRQLRSSLAYAEIATFRRWKRRQRVISCYLLQYEAQRQRCIRLVLPLFDVFISTFRVVGLIHYRAMLGYASAVLAMGLCPSASVSVRLSQVGVLSKRLNESSWVLACELPPPVLHCVKREFGYLQK